MPTNVILGSGVVGLAAKKLLSGNWTMIPFGRSRFYSFQPPLADNHIISDQAVDEAMAAFGLVGGNTTYVMAYSIAGQLEFTHNDQLCAAWLAKVMGDAVPGQAVPYYSRRLLSPIYQNARISQIYQSLATQFIDELRREAGIGEVTEIGEHYLIRGGKRLEFDNAVSTIPLDALCRLMGKEMQLKYQPESIVLVESDRIDLEGANQALVADAAISFYRVTNIAPGLYMFYFNSDVRAPGAYLLPIIGNAEIIDGTMIRNAIPIGNTPDLSWLAQYGIYPVGSYAQHDWCADFSSNILRLIRYAQRGYKQA